MSAESTSTYRQREPLYAAGIIALHLAVAIPLAVYLNIWIDEAYTLRTSSRDLAFAIHNSGHFEQQPPMYFSQLWAWRQINHSIPWARMNSVCIVAIALWLVYLAARRWFTSVSPLWAVGAVALNTYTLYASTELRPYCMVLLLSSLLIYLFHVGFFERRGKPLAQMAYAAVALVSLFTYYYLGFILVAMAAALLVERRWRALLIYCLWMASVGLLYIPGFLATTGHIHTVAHAIGAPPSWLRSVIFVVGRVFAMPLALPEFEGALRPLRWVVGGLLVVATAAAAWIARDRATPQVRALWIAVAVIAFFYFLDVRFVMGESVFARHSLVMLVPTSLALISLAALLAGRIRTRALVGWIVAVALLNAAGSYIRFGDLAKVGDYRRVARYIEANEKPGQSIAIIASHAELPFKWYYRGKSKLTPLPAEDDLTGYNLEKWRLDSTEQVRQALRKAEAPDGSVWVFADRPPDSVFLGLKLNFDYLEDVLKQDYELVNERDFYHGKLRLYHKRDAMLANGASANAV